ncbi:hypothetical protein CEXT_152081 [Caerostris extrusa]|uniref:Uncharacterized protein n=1 Tax=Caerostris extrusa TaxID=172846 RepID=A0AAV4SQ67_CAEEX|nr:hypothetical protein CEXT_152081 [Caerostris extrusa]
MLCYCFNRPNLIRTDSKVDVLHGRGWGRGGEQTTRGGLERERKKGEKKGIKKNKKREKEEGIDEVADGNSSQNLHEDPSLHLQPKSIPTDKKRSCVHGGGEGRGFEIRKRVGEGGEVFF